MKKFIIPMMLGLITVGALTSCNSEPTTNLTNENYNIVNVKRANEIENSKIRVVNEIGENDIKDVIVSNSSELGLKTTKVTKPSYDDFGGQTSFEYMGYTYTATENDSGGVDIKRTAYASDAKTIDIVYAGSVDGGSSFTSSFSGYADFDNATTLVNVMSISNSIMYMEKLETIVAGSSLSIGTTLKTTIKNIVFSTDPVNLSGLKYLHSDVKLIAPASIAANIKKKINITYNNEKEYISKMPLLYVIPDDEMMYVEGFRPCYEIGGAYITASKSTDTEYGISFLGSNIKKAVIDLSLLSEKEYSYSYSTSLFDYENYEIEELYYSYPSYNETNDIFSNITSKKLYLGSLRSEFWAVYFKRYEEVYFLDTITTGYENVYINNGDEFGNTKFFFPENMKENEIFLSTIQTMEDAGYNNVFYYDASTYKPIMEVEVNGVRKSTQDMSVSYSDLVAEAAEEAEKVSNNENEVSEDEMTEEEKEKLAQDQAAADEVVALIDTIGEVTLDSRDVIVNTKAAYDELTYDQQQLVENKETLKEAVVAFNELVNEYNENLEEGEEQLELIEEINDKTKFDDFLESVKENKVLTAITVVLGTVLGGFLIYGIYKLISKLIKWVKR